MNDTIRCKHADSLWGRCADCGMTWAAQAHTRTEIAQFSAAQLGDAIADALNGNDEAEQEAVLREHDLRAVERPDDRPFRAW